MSVTWDTVQVTERPMSHDMPCPRCGHALHVFVECGEPCGCSACPMPGARFEPFGVMQSVHPHLQLQRSARS